MILTIRSCPLAGQYLLKQHLLIHDKPITVRGEGVGLSKLVWAEDAASVGIIISQGARQGDQTDFTRVQHLSFYTRQKDVGEGWVQQSCERKPLILTPVFTDVQALHQLCMHA